MAFATHTPSKCRLPSPTSTMDDLDSSHSSLFSSSSFLISSTSMSSLHRSVSCKETLVTDVVYRPKTRSGEKRELYYNSADMHRFQKHYKMQVWAASMCVINMVRMIELSTQDNAYGADSVIVMVCYCCLLLVHLFLSSMFLIFSFRTQG